MGKVTISFEMTLDGAFDQMEHWFDENDPGLQRASDELVFGADAVLLGRESYEFFREYWPKQTDDRGFAAHYNALPKYVASTTLTGPLDWNATLIEGDVAEAVRGLRDQYDVDHLARLRRAGRHARRRRTGRRDPRRHPSVPGRATPRTGCARRTRSACDCSTCSPTTRASSPPGTRRHSA